MTEAINAVGAFEWSGDFISTLAVATAIARAGGYSPPPESSPQTLHDTRRTHYRFSCLPQPDDDAVALARKLPAEKVRQLRAVFPRGVRGSPGLEISAAIRALWDWGGRSVLVYGTNGAGKTLALLFCGIRAINGQHGALPTSARYLSVADLEAGDVEAPPLVRAGVLLLDDLHRAAEIQPWRRQKLYGILDGRRRAGRPTVAASRRGPVWLDNHLGGEWTDRLMYEGGLEVDAGQVNLRRPVGEGDQK